MESVKLELAQQTLEPVARRAAYLQSDGEDAMPEKAEMNSLGGRFAAVCVQEVDTASAPYLFRKRGECRQK
ncbi:MAG TPA: hypothetical protein VGU90_11260, partial [Terriglobales bacterium]|nr:hypothetical protein [Terriglobales bacterium]